MRYHAQGLRIHQIDGLPGSEGKDAVEGFVKVVLVGFQIYMPDMGRAQAIFQAQQGVAGQYRLAVPDIDSRHAGSAAVMVWVGCWWPPSPALMTGMRE